MKKSRLWAICNLIMAAVILGLIALAFAYETDALGAYLDTIEDQGERLGAAIGTVAIVIFMGLATGAYLIAAALLVISSIGLFSSGKKGFLIAGAVAKFLALVAFFLMEILTVSAFSRVLYIALALLYAAGGILDIVFRKKSEESL